MLVGHCGVRHAALNEVTAIALSNTFNPVSEIEKLISTFGNDGFGRASNTLYVAFVNDPYLRLFQLDRAVGSTSYDRTLKLGSVVELKPTPRDSIRIDSSLDQVTFF